MPQRGAVHEPNHQFERVGQAIEAHPDAEFTAANLVGPTGLSRSYIGTILSLKHQKGVLQRVGRGQYRRISGIPFTRKASLGVYADAVFAVLFTSPDRRPLRLPEIAGEVESYLATGESCYGAVSSILTIWAKTQVVERTGRCHEYTYSLKPGITERPVCSSHALDA